jgi:eukaryotic-like serine/threonine-protein kinase
MTPEQFDRVMQVFDQLAGLPQSARQQQLEQFTDLDEVQKAHLQRLLAADEVTAGKTARRAVALDSRRSRRPVPGTRIGPFEVDAEIGSGGMGTVFHAHRCDGQLEQQVAIKLVQPERIDEATLARFRVERQVLSMLRHPHIAALLEVGELAQGQPYVAMEYIEGEPITEHVRSRDLGLRQRLALFLQVCDAVNYAHASLIVHRDLKPSNILVTAAGQTKLLDFGIAKPLTAQLGRLPIQQTLTAQRFFSLNNVAPEQLLGDPVTPTVDIYGLGMLLYEMLCAVPAFDFSLCTPAQAETLILEEDPPDPSDRVAALAEGPLRASAVPARQLAGDLDAIVMRCLRKTPADRYRHVDDLVADINAYLAARPVAAREGKLAYRSWRFLRRHGRLFSAVALLALAVAAVTWLYLDQGGEIDDQRERAERVTALILDALKTVDPNALQGRDVSAREVFERVAGQAAADPQLDPDVRADLLLTVAAIDNRIGAHRQALSLLDQLRLPRGDLRRRDQAELQRAESLAALGDYAGARALLDGRQALMPGREAALEWVLLAADIELQQGRYTEALALLQGFDAAGLPAAAADRLHSRQAAALQAAGQPQRAAAAYAALLATQRESLPATHPELLRTLLGYAEACWQMQQFGQMQEAAAEAARIAETLYGRRSLGYLQAAGLEQRLAARQGDTATALQLMREYIDIARDVHGSRHPGMVALGLELAELYGRADQTARADAQYRELITTAAEVMQADDPRLLAFRAAYGVFLVRNERLDEAGPVVAAALAAAAKYPRLKDNAALPLLRLVETLSTGAALRSAEQTQRVRDAMAAAREAAVSPLQRETLDTLLPAAQRQGAE